MWTKVLCDRAPAVCVALLATLSALVLPSQAGATTWKVANNGTDSSSCGTNANPCRSITQAIANASDGDKIVVGPGNYGDLNGDGILGNSPGEENPGVGSGCMICVNKSVTLISSDGAAETVIDARLVPNLSETVAIVADNVKFGAAGQGFTVTNVLTAVDQENPTYGITTGADQVTIRGNRVIVERSEVASPTFSGVSAGNFPPNDNTVLIEGNQVIGWELGIAAGGVNVTVTQNSGQFNYEGIGVGPGVAKNNVATGNSIGIQNVHGVPSREG
jgi:hypothetical protein